MEGFTFKLVVDGMEGGAVPVPRPPPAEADVQPAWEVSPAMTDGLYILSCSARAPTFAEAVGLTIADLQAAGVSVRAVRWAPSAPAAP